MDKVAAMLLCAGTALFGFAVGAVTGGKLYAPEPEGRIVEVPKVVEAPTEPEAIDSEVIRSKLVATGLTVHSLYRERLKDDECPSAWAHVAIISADGGPITGLLLCVQERNRFTIIY